MTPERWRQIEQLFQEALDRDTAERDLFLQKACAGDEELRREIESLLATRQARRISCHSPPCIKFWARLVKTRLPSIPDHLLGAAGAPECQRSRQAHSLDHIRSRN